jgi:FdhE protein
MGEIDGKRARMLFCHLCETGYPHPREKCPICAEPDAEIKTLELPDRAGYTIALCKGCGRYVKHVDRRRASDAPRFPFSDLVTLDIDALAQRQGYLKPTLTSFGF